MSTVIFPIEPVIERIKASVPLAKIVGDAADLEAALESQPNASPAIYVVRSENGSPAKYSGQVTIQNVGVQLTVALLVRSSAGERMGSGARVLFDQVAEQLRVALVGWTPDDAFVPITFLASRDDRFKTPWKAGQEIFQTNYRLQNQPT